MINKKIGLGLVFLSSLGLIACGNNPTSSEEESYPQESSVIEETMYNLAITGTGAFMQGHDWKPAEAAGIEELHFVRVDKSEWKLTNIELAEGDQFKFVFNDNWGGDIGYSGLDSMSSAYANFENADGNAKVKVPGTYDFFYHPFWVAESDKYAGNFAVALHTEA